MDPRLELLRTPRDERADASVRSREILWLRSRASCDALVIPSKAIVAAEQRIPIDMEKLCLSDSHHEQILRGDPDSDLQVVEQAPTQHQASLL